MSLYILGKELTSFVYTETNLVTSSIGSIKLGIWETKHIGCSFLLFFRVSSSFSSSKTGLDRLEADAVVANSNAGTACKGHVCSEWEKHWRSCNFPQSQLKVDVFVERFWFRGWLLFHFLVLVWRHIRLSFRLLLLLLFGGFLQSLLSFLETTL